MTGMKKLMWLRRLGGGGGEHGKRTTVTGTSPLELVNALAKKMISLLQTGLSEQTATPTPSAPVDIVCNNGALKMVDDELPSGYTRVADLKLANARFTRNDLYLTGDDTLRFAYSIGANGNVVGCYDEGNTEVSYSYYATRNSPANYLRYDGGQYSSTSVFNTRYDVVITPTGSTGTVTPQTWERKSFTTSVPFSIGATSPTGARHGNLTMYGNVEVDGKAKFIPCVHEGTAGYYDTYSKVFYTSSTGTVTAEEADYSHLSLGVVGTPEVITVGEHTASAENLFAVGDYADTQDIVSGAVNRKCGVLVLDGTENWADTGTSGTNAHRFSVSIDAAGTGAQKSICTHIERIIQTNTTSQSARPCIRFSAEGSSMQVYVTDNTETLATFTAWLASQYAQGTPVTVLYPLANPTTESVTPQSLPLAKGDNTLTVTAEVEGIELSATYMMKEE